MDDQTTPSNPEPKEEAPQSTAPESMPTPEMPEQPSAASQNTVTSEETPAPEVMSTDMPTPQSAPIIGTGAAKPKKKLWAISSIILILLIILGGVAAAYYYWYMPHQPRYVLAKALGNSVSESKVMSAHFAGNMSFTDNKTKQIVKGSFTGGSDTSKFELNGSLGLGITNLTMDFRAFKDGAAYIKLGGLDGAAPLLNKTNSQEAKILAPFIGAVNNQWIELDQSLVANLDQRQLTTSSWKVSASDAQKIEGAYKKYPFLTVSSKLSDETINSMSSYHYRVTVDKNGLINFIQYIKTLNISLPVVSQGDIAKIQSADFSKYPVDIWIAKKQLIVSQIAFTTVYKDATVALSISWSDINQTLSIPKPANAQSLLQLLSGVGGAAIPGITGLGSGALNGATAL